MAVWIGGFIVAIDTYLAILINCRQLSEEIEARAQSGRWTGARLVKPVYLP